MTTALYRRYRPEAFGEMIGQSQVTDPLMTALRGDRVGHAYLFSGPRGCGKTTSARILARCLNCAEGPTDTPCGTCDSCVELGRGGGGSLDVVEIDAASHNGVDDARDLRERAVFAPARDRFKIFILDEAHMVTPQGFNALLKLVEEPPAHVKFIFATTEPEKVIGTIRSRTHHYPFRLVPPAAMLEYVASLCESEGVEVEPGVLPLVVRAGGGSPRDTLSLLDQLIAGSDGAVGYERAIALLGYTHGELLDAIVDAFAQSDAAAVFSAVDRVVQTGQDPRRFVDDLLERLRDLIVVDATGAAAAAVLRGVSAEDLARMTAQATAFGAQRLSRTADIVIAALDEMTGATSPRLQLELLCARVLAQTGVLAGGAAAAPAASPAPAVSVPAAPAAPAASPAPVSAPSMPTPVSAPVVEAAAAPSPVVSGPITAAIVRENWDTVLARLEDISRTSWLVVVAAEVVDFADDVLTLSFANAADVVTFKHLRAGAGPSEDLRTAIKAVLGIRVKYLAKHDPGAGSGGGAPDVPSDGASEGGPSDADPDPAAPSARPAPSDGVGASAPAVRAPSGAPSTPRSAPAAAAPVTDWAVAPIPRGAEAPADAAFAPAMTATAQPVPERALAVDEEPDEVGVEASASIAPPREGDVLAPEPRDEPSDSDDDGEDFDAPRGEAPVLPPPLQRTPGGSQRYGEAVVRQVLGARFVREEPHNPGARFS